MSDLQVRKKWKQLSRVDRSEVTSLALKAYKAGAMHDLLLDEGLTVPQRMFIRENWEVIEWLVNSVPFLFYNGAASHLD